jgi:dTDP-4-dehydrorhamnose reductase
MRMALTGAGGMLATDVRNAAASAGLEVCAWGHAELDVTDRDALATRFKRIAPDVVVNCAAWTDVDRAETAEAQALAVNGEGAGNVARAAVAAGAWTIHISSDYVFAGDKLEPYVESDPAGPLSAYGRSKLAGEEATAEAAPESHTILRSSWLFGIGGRCFPRTILKRAAEHDALTVVDDQVGTPTFTGHLAHALVELAERRLAGVVHIAGGGQCSWYDFARAIVALAELPTEITPGRTEDTGRPAPRPRYSALRSERPAAPVLPHWREGLAAFMACEALTSERGAAPGNDSGGKRMAST